MAGNAGNWFKVQAGQRKGQSMYLSRDQQVELVGRYGANFTDAERRAEVLGYLEQRNPSDSSRQDRALYQADRERPAGAPRADPFRARSVNPAAYDEGAAQAEYGLFGRSLEPTEMRRLFGALPEATVDVFLDDDNRGRLTYKMTHPMIRDAQYRSVYVGDDGRLVIENVQLLLKDDAPPGLGTRMLAMQVKAAAAFGVSHLELTAGGPPEHRSMVGYYVWPRLGFDGSFNRDMHEDSTLRSRMPPQFAGARRISDLFKMPGGADWWRANGEEMSMRFSLTEGSQSRRVLDAYTKAKGIEV